MSPYSLILLSVFLVTGGLAIRCHKCSGAEKIPSFVTNAAQSLNISNFPVEGDCKSKSDACENGLFCLKKASVYQIGWNKVNFKWTTFTKECASVRADNGGIPTNDCFDVSTEEHEGYKKTIRHCYCMKDFCNTTATTSIITTLTIFTVLSWMFSEIL